MKTWGLRTLSQRVARAIFRDSLSAPAAVSLTRSGRNPPLGRKMSSIDSSGLAILRVLAKQREATVLIMAQVPAGSKEPAQVSLLQGQMANPAAFLVKADKLLALRTAAVAVLPNL